MKLETLFEKTRILISDFRYNSNSSASDQENSDESLMGYYQMAINEFDFHTQYNQGDYETDLSIQIENGKNVYKLPSNILRIHSVTIDGYSIRESIYMGEEKYAFGFSTSYQLDFRDGYIRLSPAPTSGVLKFRGVVSTEVFDLSDLDQEIPLPKKYHEYLKYYKASKCLERVDYDTNDSNKSKEYMQQFLNFCRMVKLEVQRRQPKIIFHNGSYNT